jgi:hypothetical protein
VKGVRVVVVDRDYNGRFPLFKSRRVSVSYGTLSGASGCDMSMRLQQTRFAPHASKAAPPLLPLARCARYSTYLVATWEPQE